MPELWKSVNKGEPVELSRLPVVANELLQATHKKVWRVDGEMGAGKTTLIKLLCEALGVREVMSSPTFSIVNEYTTANSQTIYHFDFYRLKKETEAMDIGVEEYLDSGNYCFLEWSEKISSLLPEVIFNVRIREHTPATRLIEYSDHE
ncbi:MAG: tRNA (adenosine(37)-N6)-threonylcarbamoyltransferase complex ATPase subunit type 1 TsaE [Azospira oryzae]|jgi:tRNA threonylcarbamoyladenosine biosynthesis protein TsaE|nr:MAG: tRNA (adenosine(37)-N6)-threonylcarbamoyltransferase complex ATPase subunit type 1 TsaE [Azospira oryzae]